MAGITSKPFNGAYEAAALNQDNPDSRLGGFHDGTYSLRTEDELARHAEVSRGLDEELFSKMTRLEHVFVGI